MVISDLVILLGWLWSYLCNQYLSTNVVSSDPANDGVYSLQHYVIKFVSDLRQVGGFHRVIRFPPPIKKNMTVTMY